MTGVWRGPSRCWKTARESLHRSCVLNYDALAKCVLTVLAAAFLAAIIFGDPAPGLMTAALAASLISVFLFFGQWYESAQPVAPNLPLFRSRT